MGHEGINRLARVLDGRTKDHGDNPPILDFGSIQSDMSLLANNFPLPIPQSDYLVCRSVTWGAIDDILYKTQYPGNPNSGEHSHADGGGHSHPLTGYATHTHAKDAESEYHIHDCLIGPKTRWLQPGDRVLIVWVGDDACVIDIILPAATIG